MSGNDYKHKYDSQATAMFSRCHPLIQAHVRQSSFAGLSSKGSLSCARRHPVCLLRWGSSTTKLGPLELYHKKVQAKEYRLDPHQIKALEPLQSLHQNLVSDYPHPPEMTWARQWGLEAVPETPKGVYLHGGVGCGKTFLMDLFYTAAPTNQKRRIHFHKWMLELHQRLHTLKKDQEISGNELLAQVAREMVREHWLLCLDEFQVTDIADALLIRQLFMTLMAHGAVIVSTSNRHPTQLYKNGLQRDLFLPFIDLLMETCHVHSLEKSTTDYRMEKSQFEDHANQLYLSSRTSEHQQLWETIFRSRIQHAELRSIDLQTQGRKIHIPIAAVEQRIARFTFAQLCEKPLGAADYICIAQAFDEVFIDHIPKFNLNQINAIRRFITLIDCFYDYQVILRCFAQAAPHELFHQDAQYSGKFAVQDEVFSFDRTISRLIEMQSPEYLHQCHNNYHDVKTGPPSSST